MLAIKVSNLTKDYSDGKNVTKVLRGIDMEIIKGEFVAIMGRSGAGKSTLLYQLGLLDKPTSGSIELMGKSVAHLDEQQKSIFRLNELGFIFQDYALLPELTALENVALPLLMQGKSRETAFALSKETLMRVGMEGKEKTYLANFLVDNNSEFPLLVPLPTTHILFSPMNQPLTWTRTRAHK